MVIDKDSLQALNIAINDWDDNNRSSEDYEENRLRLEEIYSVIHREVEHSKNPTHILNYSTDMVCDLCGSNEWHVNMFFKNSSTGSNGWFYGDDGNYGCEDVWCHECESYRNLVAPDEYEEDGE